MYHDMVTGSVPLYVSKTLVSTHDTIFLPSYRHLLCYGTPEEVDSNSCARMPFELITLTKEIGFVID